MPYRCSPCAAASVKSASGLPFRAVKLHQLLTLKKTPLASPEFPVKPQPLNEYEYMEQAAEFLHRVETLAQERGVKAFRIDTNFDNQTMLQLLERTGFTYCGKVVYRSGERLAYEKRI